ncbi:MAG: hypothetical protein FJW23_15605, partial [Acidimicrobiia bacterium]|nr:hypothetical protein [Acidimicrobiia bacterium]
MAVTVAAATTMPAIAGAQVVTSNPLDEMKARVQRVLDDARLPFSEQQSRELSLVMEEQRQVSERLFGDIMDFSRGAVRGADRDRALAGIQWMNEAFEATLRNVLTAEQNEVWEAFRVAEIRRQGGLPALRQILAAANAPLSPEQDQRASVAYLRAAEQLRSAEEAGTVPPGGETTVARDTLEQIADLLLSSQATAVLQAVDPASPWAPAVPLAVDEVDGSGRLSDTTGETGTIATRNLLVTALGAVAWPTATFVGGTGATGARSSNEISQIRM